jgi:hypothetical protein
LEGGVIDMKRLTVILITLIASLLLSSCSLGGKTEQLFDVPLDVTSNDNKPLVEDKFDLPEIIEPIGTKLIEINDGIFLITYNEVLLMGYDQIVTVDIQFTLKTSMHRSLYTSSFGSEIIIQARLVNKNDSSITFYDQYYMQIFNEMILDVNLEPNDIVRNTFVFSLYPQGSKSLSNTYIPNGIYVLEIGVYNYEMTWINTEILVQVLV